MNVGDLVRLKSNYPIWLFSYGITVGDLGLILKMVDDSYVEVYWIKIRRSGRLFINLIELVE
jgi:hypothetical protein